MHRQVVVTGSASGIGAAVTELLTADGDRVIGVDQRDADVLADLSTAEGRTAAIEGVRRSSGGTLDAIVACAGTAAPTPVAVAVNFFGVVELLEGLREQLARAAQPRVAVTSSIASTQPSDAAVLEACAERDVNRAAQLAEKLAADGRGYQLYTSSKLALAHWVRRACITQEWAGNGIALNAVAPGVVVTPMTDALRADENGAALMDRAVPMKLNGWAPPEAVAYPLRWLASPENTHVTGQIVFVDGGAEACLRGENAF